ncbi:type II toxin-antitoxin system RelE/ParE family toxin [Paenalcaligenes suwonensis]|uniref:type II toxin-antitoxin system RelE/ParE family toxin n=1 Tax=Paenalcaligenes suwonensis TaxID=1202713 RepID=UPI00140CB40E|nr:type II toxin-antitoxin system RelE/ParE family toxin [Paenalcaligenes suwonensis]NHC62686.1 type II toxin-antitoxin system RelE/ParE family toxin [Paenalcaligenes suwonensis]
MKTYSIEHYLTEQSQDDLYLLWLARLRDLQAKIAVIRRMHRIEQGNFGDHAFCRDGVWELRIDIGPGYRVYYALTGRSVVLLLCGGNKHSQNKDIQLAVRYWQDWQRRNDNEKSHT